ncbi:hypothetical protein AAFF_G00230190 [Aldrovandia affinis]|uniref:Uncharacterized protein n=1 Tax=Aldrovandia affinis TaxID=143900 RepID=A0AAD7WUL4_9TELE|nr:hypothetical protein AAFF_G00230190 [Aldrovandia affinis]
MKKVEKSRLQLGRPSAASARFPVYAKQQDPRTQRPGVGDSPVFRSSLPRRAVVVGITRCWPPEECQFGRLAQPWRSAQTSRRGAERLRHLFSASERGPRRGASHICALSGDHTLRT